MMNNIAENWDTHTYYTPKRRVKRVFLFLPKKLRNRWRWFEFAEIRQAAYYCEPIYIGFLKRDVWEDIDWVD